MLVAVIFDLDGTILLNEEIWDEIFAAVAAENNISFTRHIPGIGVENNWHRLVSDPEKARALAYETKQRYLDQKIVKEIPVREGFAELLDYLKERGLLTALATGSTWDVVEDEVEKLNMLHPFDVVTTGEEVAMQKPEPDIYTLTAQKLGVEPENCLVIEDSEAGVEAATAAGCRIAEVSGLDNFSEVVVLLQNDGNQNEVQS